MHFFRIHNNQNYINNENQYKNFTTLEKVERKMIKKRDFDRRRRRRRSIQNFVELKKKKEPRTQDDDDDEAVAFMLLAPA